MEEFDLEKEQRRECLKWVFYGGLAMLFVVCGFYIQLTATQRVLHAYGLTVLVYGALLYVEEFAHLKKLWLWKGVLVTIPLHIAFLFIIWVAAWIETRLMDQIADDYRPWTPVSESGESN